MAAEQQDHINRQSEEDMATRTADFRNAMSRLAAAVTIVTTDGDAGKAGFAATAVCSVSDNPPTLLVCLNKNSSAHGIVRQNARICVNVLTHAHQDVSAVFGGKTPMAERFNVGAWAKTPAGLPALSDALLHFDCVIDRIADGGTHDILIAEVKHTSIQPAKPLIYFERGYHSLHQGESEAD